MMQDWAERCRSLKRLQGLDARLEKVSCGSTPFVRCSRFVFVFEVMGSSHLEGFVLALLRLRELLLAQALGRATSCHVACRGLRLRQVTDLRSALVREARPLHWLRWK